MKNKRKTRIIIQEKQAAEINLSKELGKFLLDISKLIIGGAVITTALELNSDRYLLILIALIAALIFAIIGFLILIYLKH